jgi:hypothetical protein
VKSVPLPDKPADCSILETVERQTLNVTAGMD